MTPGSTAIQRASLRVLAGTCPCAPLAIEKYAAALSSTLVRRAVSAADVFMLARTIVSVSGPAAFPFNAPNSATDAVTANRLFFLILICSLLLLNLGRLTARLPQGCGSSAV
jgi:hypothetical protein